MRTTLTLFLILINFSSYAYEVPEECKTPAAKDCVNCVVPTSTKPYVPAVVKTLDKTFGELSFIEERVNKLDLQNTYLKKSFAALFRTLRDGDLEVTATASRKEIALIQQDFDRLTALSKETTRLQNKFNWCTTNCSAYAKVEIQDQIEATQKLKIALFIKRPILANKFFEEKMLSMNYNFIKTDNTYSKVDFEKVLKDALFDNLQKIDQRSKEFGEFQYDGDKPLQHVGNEKYGKEYLDKMASKFPEITNDILSSSVDIGDLYLQPNKTYVCNLAEKFQSYSVNKKRIELAVDAGLLIAPLALGPLGVEAALVARLGGWGLKTIEIKNAIKASSLVFQGGLAAKDISGVRELARQCNVKEVNFISKSSEAALEDLKNCQKDLGDKIFISELSIGIGAVANFSEGTVALLSKGLKINKTGIKSLAVEGPGDIGKFISKYGVLGEKNQLGMEFPTAHSGTFSVLNLERMPNITNPNLKSLPETYWRYVGNIYKERLKLTNDEIENFIKSSLEMSPRTKLVVNTVKSPASGELKINGGIGLVHSDKATDLLPLEKATGLKLERPPGAKIAEIVRLSVGKDGDAEKLSILLVNQCLNLIKSDKDIQKIYIYTSKAHSRMYEKIGVPKGSIKALDKRDVLIELDRSVILDVINKQEVMKIIYMNKKKGLKNTLQTPVAA